MPDVIFKAVSDNDYEEFARLIRAYVDWCRVRNQDHPWVVDMAFSYQALEKELEQLSRSYGGSNGMTLLARGGQIKGGVAYRRLTATICEMKRLYVLEEFQGTGLGKRLCKDIMNEAKAAGFTMMRLDTGNLFHEAQTLYRSLGFVRCEAYYDYPVELEPFLVFMEKSLD